MWLLLKIKSGQNLFYSNELIFLWSLPEGLKAPSHLLLKLNSDLLEGHTAEPHYLWHLGFGA